MPRSPPSVCAPDSQSSGKNGPPPCAIAPRSAGSSDAVMAGRRGAGSSSSRRWPGGLQLAAYAGRPRGPWVTPQSPSGSRGPPATPGPGQLRPGVVPGGTGTGSPPVRPDSARSPPAGGAGIACSASIDACCGKVMSEKRGNEATEKDGALDEVAEVLLRHGEPPEIWQQGRPDGTRHCPVLGNFSRNGNPCSAK